MAKYGDLEASPDDGQNQFSDIIKSRSDEHNDVQKKTFTKWINARFSKVSEMLVDFTLWSVPPSDLCLRS